ncbi:hypothetical protein N9123_01935 [Pseudomonadales bacterium]|nr:hypothetical protein [Pseudomonadales bacterium]
MQKRYEAETGSTMFSKPPRSTGGRYGGGRSKDKKAFEEWSKTTGGMDAGKDRFNAMIANRSQNPVLGQTQSGMSGFDKFQAMQAAGSNPQLMQSEGSELLSILAPSRAREISAANDVRNQQAGYDRFQAMQAARDSVNSTYGQKIGMEALSKAMAAKGDPKGIWLKATQNYRNRNSGQPAGYDRFQAQTEANPLILQQLQQQQMGQRQMGPQFNAFGFGAQPGLNAQGGQGGSMLANMSSQGMNQLAAGQQNNPTIFKAKS